MSWWPAVVFGWPSIVVAIVLAVLGITKRRSAILVASAVAATPFSLYLSGSPGIGWLGLVNPPLLISAGVAIRCRNVRLAWMLIVPVLAVVVWVATLVLWE